jgi:phospholipid/cholesterol/gamma-HCH transport system permease protein
MNINREIDSLCLMNISIPRYIFLPRILAFIIAGPSLAIFFSVTGLIGSFFILGFFHDITFDNYLDQLFFAIEIKDVAVVVLKPAVMAAAIGAISVQNGMGVKKAFTEVPVMLIRGMIQSLAVIALVEVLFASLI